jgi:hypothetical protein
MSTFHKIRIVEGEEMKRERERERERERKSVRV